MTDSTNTANADFVEVDAPVVFEIPAYRLEEFQKRVTKANNRLGRAGGTERFTFTFEEFPRKEASGGVYNDEIGVWIVQPTWVEVTYIRATLVNDSFRLAVGDYTFVASLVAEEAGYTVHTAPEQNLEGWTRPDVNDIHCDHCNTVRNRINIYIVRNNVTGELLQLGSNCIAPFLGFAPGGLWALTFTESLRDLQGEDEGSAGYGRRERSALIDEVIAAAWVFTHHGKNYVSKSAAFDGRVATAGRVSGYLFEVKKPPTSRDSHEVHAAWQQYLEDVKEIRAMLAEGNTEAATLIAAIKAVAETATKAGTDYGDNLRTILAADSGRVSIRNIGTTASLVAVYARELQLAEERARKAPLAAGFIGKVGERVRNFSITLTNVREFEGDFGWTTLLVGTTEDNHVVKWFASGRHDYDLGDVIKLEAATVKAHEEYKGTDQTVLTRGKIDTFEERAQSLQAELDRTPRDQWTFVTTRYDYTTNQRVEYTVSIIDRWLNSKAEIKRFAAWQAEQKSVEKGD